MTDVLLDGTILRHAIGRGPDGLSPLQSAMLREERPVRIYAAPTGAGKSYAFQRAVTTEGACVLFIVPTRRLAENLARSLREDLGPDGDQRVILWTSDERARIQEADPTVRIGRLRLRQLRGYDAPEKGTMILATPESIAWMLLRPARQTAGTPQTAADDFLRRFDHIVFDEFHTIDPRGMGLCVAFARFTALIPNGPKITFLSATPIGLRATLEACEIPDDKIAEGSEEVITGPASETPGLRAIHGDVRLEFVDADGPLAALMARQDRASACLARGRQLVLIYDSLVRLKNERNDLAALLDALGVAPHERLSINSLDDSRAVETSGAFSVGRDIDPLGFRVLVATSSVEMGVTFKAGMIVMDPGHESASFVQRVGRAARGDEPGDVIVATPPGRTDRDPWVRDLIRRLEALGPVFGVDRFCDACLEAAREAFKTRADEAGDNPDRVYRSMPARAAWCAALFWAALENASPGKGVRDTLRDFSFAKSNTIAGILRTVASAGPNGEVWRNAMLEEARTLRQIGASVTLRAPSGRTGRLSAEIYLRSPALQQMPSRLQKDGETLEILLDRELNDIPELGGGRGQEPMAMTLLPHVALRVPMRARGIADAWVTECDAALLHPRLSSVQEKAIRAAVTAVRMTGIVPCERPMVEAVAEGSAIL
jgi:hypothetical protein